MFIETTMFGQTKYVYRPNLIKLSFMLHCGKSNWRFEALSSETLKNALKKVNATYVIESHFDSNGFRKTGLKNNKNLPTVLFVGDSFTEGLWVNDNETFVHYVGLLMERDNYGYPINAGVNGYGTLEKFWVIKKFAPILKYKMVILNHATNDIYKNYWDAVKKKANNIDDLWNENLKWLKKIDVFCKEKGIKLVISIIPLKSQLEGSIYKKYYHQRLEIFCKKHDILFINVTEKFKDNIKEELYIPNDPHFSVTGHKLYAQLLWEDISKSH